MEEILKPISIDGEETNRLTKEDVKMKEVPTGDDENEETEKSEREEAPSKDKKQK